MAKRSEARQEVYKRIDEERAYQDGQWAALDKTNEVADFLSYMRLYLRKAEELNRSAEYLCLGEIRKIAALAVACQEKLGLVYRRSDTSVWERKIAAPVARFSVYDAICEENAYQEGRPDRNPPRVRTLGTTLVLLRVCLDYANAYWVAHKLNEHADLYALDEIRKVGAIAVRALEELGCPPRV